MRRSSQSVAAIIAIGAIVLSVLSGATVRADLLDDCKRDADAWVEDNAALLDDAALAINEFAEVALIEHQSAAYLADMLEDAGFSLERGVAGMPTAFVATYGSGRPVVGILCEYDALPGLSQMPGTTRKIPVTEDAPGHGCGHSLFGAGSTGAALAVAAVMRERGIAGTVKLFGCPAEETVVGKVYMARDGLFDGLDACFNWHPGSKNQVRLASNNALNNFEVTFTGKTAHAAADPHNGRSALDAVELMNTGVNFLREHVRDSVRMHYMVKHGGMAPNIVPEMATVWYYVRDVNREGVESTYARVLDIAQGAALMTGTEHTVFVNTGTYNYLPNEVLSKAVHDNLLRVGPAKVTDEERAFANEFQRVLDVEEKGYDTKIVPYDEPQEDSRASTDASDVSWIVPTSGELTTACIPTGMPGHSWAVASCSGATVGLKSMRVAAKVLAMSGLDVLLDRDLTERATAEFDTVTEGFTYKSAVPADQPPPLPVSETR
jgi:aminobenzoyl-glutamate utilization protein B